MAALVALCLLAAPPLEMHRFVHLLRGSPIGDVVLRRDGGRYHYLSRHFFRRGKTSVERFEPTAAPEGAQWASESLLRPHPVGCWSVEDEVTRQRGLACVTRPGPRAEGTLLGQRFTARYAEDGGLEQLELADSVFVRTSDPVEFEDPFGAGFELAGAGAQLGLKPPLEGTRPAAVKPAGTSAECLSAAEAWVAEHGVGWEVVLGLVEDEGRAWPHAWVRARATGEEVDPSRPLSSAPTHYLALPAGRAATVYLELLGKQRAVVRVARP